MDSLANLKSKIVSEEILKIRLLNWRLKNDKIVFTNGCFDILHKGHISLLYKAKHFGNRLIVGLNTDSSVKILKGNNRPFNNQDDRALLLAAIAVIDLVVLFNEETPKKLIENIIPNVLVKGGDYIKNEIVGADFVEKNGGKVEVINLEIGYSTTKILDKK